MPPRFFYWRKELGQANLADTLIMFVKHIENFLEAFAKKRISAPKIKFCQNIPTPFWVSFPSHFLSLNFWKKASRNFSVDFTNMFKMSTRSDWPRSLRQYNNCDRTTHPSDHMSGKVKTVEILKNEAQSHVEYSDKTTCFELQLFFQVALEKFLQYLRQHWSYLGGPINLVLCVSRQILTIRSTNLIICQEIRKNENSWDFEKWSSKSYRIFW